MADSSDKLVLITGATGHVGFAVLVSALEAGYTIRASVRRASQGEELKSHALVKPFSSRLETVVVPDITVSGAYDSALHGVTHVLHLASPIPRPTEDAENDIVKPAANSTRSILQSAVKSTTLRRIVITSSVVAIVPFEVLINGDPNTVFTAESRVRPLPSGPWNHEGPAYAASKALALDLSDRFMDEEKPNFSLVNIMPGLVVGPNRLLKTVEQMTDGGNSNRRILSVALGEKSPVSFAMNLVGISDAARIHVQALDETMVPGNQSFVLDSHRPSYDEVNDIVAQAFPEAVRDGTFPLGGHQPGAVVRFDTESTTKTFGPFVSYEKDVVDLFRQYIELKGNVE